MGGAASTLTKAQAEEMARLKKLELEANPGASEEDINKIMLEKHKEALDKAIKQNEADAAKIEGASQSLPSGKSNNSKSSTKNPTRRRSFGEEKKPASGTSSKEGTGISVSASTPVIEAVKSAAANAADGATPAADNSQKDSWDSVSEQPYCAVCCMGFKTASALDRHVKYSDLHAKQVAKLNKEGTPVSPGATPFGKDKKTLQPTQEEGTHYRLFYSGSKLFWRTSDNIDIDIYFHVIAHCIEVIAFDSVKVREWRLYFQYEKLCALLDQQVKENVKSKKSEHNKEAATNKFVVNPSQGVSAAKWEEVMMEEARQTIITSFLLNRIQMVSAASPASPVPEVKFVASQAGDDVALLTSPPGGLIPVQVNRRRKTSSEEITSTISTLQMDYAALRNATARAERIASLVFEGASTFSALVQKEGEEKSKWAKMWRWAIRLVIRQRCVAETTAHLEKLEAARLAREKEQAAAEPTNSRSNMAKMRRSLDGAT